ncbi:MAG: EamA family transporter [Planctomycetes bacterium]|nr:EamA family transporter [Planctomycetota bacterium]
MATFALTSVCIFWGATFLLMDQATDALKEIFGADYKLASGSLFLAVRFALAVALMPLLIPASVRRLNKAAWVWGFWLSTVFAAGFLLQIFGLAQDDVPPSQSAFLTSLFVVTTPLIQALIGRRPPPIGVMVGVALATLGAAYIKGPPTGGLSVGAWATIACAVVFGGHIVMTDTATKRADPMALTLTMLVFATGWCALTFVLTPDAILRLDGAKLAQACSDTRILVPLVLCAVFATVIALSVLNGWQKEVSPSRAALIYTSEPVFATLISVGATALGLARTEDTINGWLFFGAGMILLANLAAEFVKRKPAGA